MRCRRIHRSLDGKRTIVWFGSYGVNANGTAKFVNSKNKHDNFTEDKEAVVDSLIQRLSVIRKELWYNVSYGIPLFLDDKATSKIVIDSAIASIVLSHPDVVTILDFSSSVKDRRYTCNMTVQSRYGVVDLTV